MKVCINMAIVVYSKVGCPFCSLLKAELRRRGHSYTEMDLSDDSVRQEFYANTGTKTVPQVFVNNGEVSLTNPTGRHIGDWSAVNKDWQALETPT